MRTTSNIDDQILKRASKLAGISEKTASVRLGLELLIARESAKWLAALDEEIFNFIEVNRHYGFGLGYIDLHLIAFALINNARIWTRDK